MLQAVHKNAVIVMFILLAVILGAIIPIALQTTAAQEVSRNNDMRELLEMLNAKIEGEAPFQVTFKFEQPLMDNEEFFWEIPNPPNEDISRWIGEIGEDFVCFFEQAGSSGVARCTPFSNIVSVSYLGSP